MSDSVPSRDRERYAAEDESIAGTSGIGLESLRHHKLDDRAIARSAHFAPLMDDAETFAKVVTFATVATSEIARCGSTP